MRDLTDNEKNIVENLLRLKRNHDLAGLQTAKILEQKSSNFLTLKSATIIQYTIKGRFMSR